MTEPVVPAYPVACAVCKRKRVDGVWVDGAWPEGTKVSHGFCPECYRAWTGEDPEEEGTR